MAPTDPRDGLAQAFDEQRARLVAMAYRVLGSRGDAEDAVQETWLRLARQDEAAIDNLPAWLTTVVSRVCIDMLRSRKGQPLSGYDGQRPELIVTADDARTPEDEALLAESLGQALLVVLEKLGPAERLAFVLHDLFAVPFDEIGPIVGRSPDATKMLASRARRKVQGADRPGDDRRPSRAVVDAFLAAARNGDLDALMRVLDPSVIWRTHAAHGVVVRRGADEVAGRALQVVTAQVTVEPVLVSGEVGIIVRGVNGKPRGLMACTIANGRIVAILSVTDPARLAEIDLPRRRG